MIIIATHAVFLNDKDVYGPPHAVSLYLNHKKISHIFLKHRLDGNGYSIVEKYKHGRLAKTIKIGSNNRKQFAVQYIYELFLTLKITFAEKERCEIFIGVDPLNAVAGNLLKFFGKARKTVYFSADFAMKRFENSFLSNFYLFLDNLVMHWSNFTWSISKRITFYRKRKGLKEQKNLLLPNAPFFDSVKRKKIDEIHKHDLVIVSKLSEGIAFELLIDSIKKLHKKYSDIRLLLIGSGEKENELRNYVDKRDMGKQVLFLGAKSHEEMFKTLVTCGVGIAFYSYSNKNHFHYFSDSMKVRDYLASGLPSLISGNSGIVEELEKNLAGKHVKLDINDITHVISNIFNDDKLYEKMRENAILLAKQYDTAALLDKYFLLLHE